VRISVGVMAQVPAEAACLPATVASVAAFGDVTVFSLDAGPEVAACARQLDVPLVEVPWDDHYGDAFNHVLDALAGMRLLTYADEFAEVTGDARGLDTEGHPGAVGIEHRMSAADGYREEDEIRLLPEGTDLRYADRLSKVPYREGAAAAVSGCTRMPLLLVHEPARWPGLIAQRVQRTLAVVEKGLRVEPGRLDFALRRLRCYWALHDWDGAEEAGRHWLALAQEDNEDYPVVQYFLACGSVARRDLAEAEERARRAVAHTGTFADGWYLLGELAVQRGDLGTAQACFRNAADLGMAAFPVAIEDMSFSTWQPLLAMAALARRAGAGDDAARLKAESVRARRALRRAMAQGGAPAWPHR
jgi:tetratricopeptide (TPR) repeat protein